MRDCGIRRPQRFLYTPTSVRLTRPACHEPECRTCGKLYFFRKPSPQSAVLPPRLRKMSLAAASATVHTPIRKKARMRHIVSLSRSPDSSVLYTPSPSPSEPPEQESPSQKPKLKVDGEGQDVTKGQQEQGDSSLRVEKRDKIRCKWVGKKLILVLYKTLVLVNSPVDRTSS